MAGTTNVSVGPSAYVSLGTAPMYISPEGPIMIVAAASQPAATTQGHPLSFLTAPFNITLAEQIWAISLSPSNVNVTVTT